MNQKLVCVNDMPGVGKIALAAMIPILSAKGIDVSTLPTALVSNTLDYGKFEILDTTDYMEKTIEVWKQLNFKFNALSTGFMVSEKQVDLVEKLIETQEDLLVVVDPIFGDEGHLYHGMDLSNVKMMSRLAKNADVLLPNYTEACFLTNQPIKNDLKEDEARKLINACCELGSKSVVITSAKVNGNDCVIGYDHLKDEYFTINFELVNIRFPGTGDIFSAVLIADLLNTMDLKNATQHAMNVVRDIILENKENKDKYLGVCLERYIAEGKL